MCFSTTASFTAAAVLGIGGVVSLKKVTDRSQSMFAAIPLLFGIQQLSEGLLWIALGNEKYSPYEIPATYFFLFFAQMLWTTWIPLAFLFLEKDPVRKKILQWISAAGIGASLLLTYRLLFYNVHAEINSHHIQYVIESPRFIIIASSILYVIAIIFPPFVSGRKWMWMIGASQVTGLIVTKLFYTQFLISVWCFFAAALSVIVIWIMHNMEEAGKQKGKAHLAYH